MWLLAETLTCFVHEPVRSYADGETRRAAAQRWVNKRRAGQLRHHRHTRKPIRAADWLLYDFLVNAVEGENLAGTARISSQAVAPVACGLLLHASSRVVSMSAVVVVFSPALR